MKKNNTILQVKDLSKSFNDPLNEQIEVLKKIDLHVNSGEIVALIGPSGCGKTTLLDIIAGMRAMDSGSLVIDNDEINKGEHHVSYMMQNDGLLPWRRVIDNVTLPLEVHGMAKKDAKKQAKKLLHEFGLTQFENYYPSQLSGGMRQRVALGRTYLVDHDIMLMDEPFSRLDALTKLAMQEWFLHIWQKKQKTIILVTHDIDEAIFLADRIYVMSARPGNIIAEHNVSLPRPRDNDISTTTPFISLKKILLQDLKR